MWALKGARPEMAAFWSGTDSVKKCRGALRSSMKKNVSGGAAYSGKDVGEELKTRVPCWGEAHVVSDTMVV